MLAYLANLQDTVNQSPHQKLQGTKKETSPKYIVQIRESSPEFGDSCASFHLSGLGRIESWSEGGGGIEDR